MVATNWADDVARDQRARRKSSVSKTLPLPAKFTSTRNYVVGKPTHTLGYRPLDTTSGWMELVLVIRQHTRALPSWLGTVLSATTDDAARRAFRSLHAELIRLRKHNAFDAISSVLETLARQGSMVHPMLLVAGLRLTYLYRSDVACWDQTRDQIAKTLVSRNLEPSELLRGLLP